MESEEGTVGLQSRSVHRLLRRLRAAGSGASWKMLTPQFDHRAGFVHDRECRDLPGLGCGDVPRCAVGRGAAAGAYSPLSSAAAAALVPTQRRGRALSLVVSGLAVGTVFGVPLGLVVAASWGWRAAIALVVVIGAASLAGVLLRGGELPNVPASSPGQRLQ